MSVSFKTWLRECYEHGDVVDMWDETEASLYEMIASRRRFPRFAVSPLVGADYLRRVCGATPEQIGCYLYLWKAFYHDLYQQGHFTLCDEGVLRRWYKAYGQEQGLEHRYPEHKKYSIIIDEGMMPSSVITAEEGTCR